MHIFNNNVEVIKEYQAACFSDNLNCEKAFEHNQEYDCIQFLEAKNGSIYMQYNNGGELIRLNSSYNPDREAERWAEQFDYTGYANVFVMYGFGSGMFIRAIKEKMGHGDILIVYEPSDMVFYRVLNEIDITDIVKDNRIHIVRGNEAIADLFNIIIENVSWANIESVNVISHPGYEKVFPDEYEVYMRCVTDCITRIKMNGNTEVYFGKDIAYNTVKNMRYMTNSYFTQDFVGQFDEDTVGVVVAAGPSLDNNIHVLHELKDKAIIMATDTAMGRLHKEGIVPDFMVTVDPNKLESLFDDSGFEEVPLFCAIDCNPVIMEKHNAQKIWTYPSKFMEEYYKKIGIEENVYDSGGSVATNAFMLLYTLGIRTIVLIGQDLSYKDDKSHAGGLTINNVGQKKNDLYVKGNYETQVKTREDWFQYLKWYERTIANMSGEIRVINATEGGALIEGTELMTLKEVAETLCLNNKNISGIINKIFETETRDNVQICEFIKQCIEEVREIKRNSEKGITLCNRFERKYSKVKKLTGEITSIMGEISNINKKIGDKNVYWLIDEIIKHEDSESIKNIYSSSEDEYNNNINMVKNVRNILELVKKAAESINPQFEETYSILIER